MLSIKLINSQEVYLYEKIDICNYYDFYNLSTFLEEINFLLLNKYGKKIVYGNYFFIEDVFSKKEYPLIIDLNDFNYYVLLNQIKANLNLYY